MSDSSPSERASGLIASLERIGRSPWFVLALIVGATFALYAPTLNDWFQSDDFLLLRGAKELPFPVYVREAFDFRDFQPLRLFAYRPLHFVTMDVMEMAFDMNALPYHVISVGFHLINVVLVWRIARQLTNSDPIAHGTAVIFGLHPIYTTVVGWVAASNSLFATTGQLVAFLAFLQFAKSNAPGWYVLSILAYAAAILFHQEVFLLPVVIGAYLILVKFDDLRSAFIPTVATLLPYGVIFGVFLGIQRFNAKEGVINDHFVLNLDTLKNHVGMVAMSVFPSNLSGLQAIHVVAASLFAVVVLATFFVARQRWKILLLAIIWYHAALVLSELFFVDTPAIPFLGRKLYPAAPALALVIAVVAESYWELLRPRLSIAVPYILIGIAVALAFVRAGELRDGLEPRADRSRLFVNELRATFPELSEQDTLYVARAPFPSCTILVCYVRDIVTIYYGSDVAVRTISVGQAQDPAFLSILGPDDHVYCWRCPEPPDT